MHSRQIHYRKIIILITCFALTSIFIYWTPPSKGISKQIPLSEALSNINGWTFHGFSPLDPKIVSALELDDYANQNYSNGDHLVSLYIGYYLTTKKVGAAHSPLVCFPGQGWVISDKEEKSLTIRNHDVHFASLIVTRGQGKELVLYWFQAFNKTSPGTFLQKAYGLRAKLFHSREDNAFVRVSVPIREETSKEAVATAITFIDAFYPPFLKFIKGIQL